jgi:ABC-type uncharacterized transport system involved in gliding motility auxiliary subunit
MDKLSSASLTKTSSRRVLRINHYIGLVLMAFIFIAINMVGFKQFYRKNLSSNPFSQITEQSLNIIRALPEPVTIINFVAPEADEASVLISNDLEKLLAEYRYKSNGKVEVRKVNPLVDFSEARAIAQEFKLTTDENVVIIQYRGQNKVINYREMADIEPSNLWARTPPKLLAFKAEEMITSAIQSLSAEGASKVVFLSGHGEYDIDSLDRESTGYSRLAEHIRRQNAQVSKLNLLETPSIPEGTQLVVVAAPQQAYTQAEIDILRAYLQNKERPGRLLLMLDPQTQTGLEGFLENYGVVFNDDLSMIRVSILGETRLLPQAVATTFSEHPVTNWLIRSRTSINLGPARSLTLKNPAQEGAPRPVPLALTPESTWGERDFRSGTAAFDKDRDTPGPLTVAAAIDTGKVQGGEVSLQGAKVVAIGSGTFLINQLIGGAQLDFFLNAFNWLLDKQSSLGIAPKTPQEFRVSLDDSQKQKLQLAMFAVPLGAAVLGFLVWLRRRK